MKKLKSLPRKLFVNKTILFISYGILCAQIAYSQEASQPIISPPQVEASPPSYWLKLLYQSHDKAYSPWALSFNSHVCQDTANKQEWLIPITSEFSQERIQVAINNQESPPQVSLGLGGKTFMTMKSPLFSSDFTKKICSKWDQKTNVSLVLSEEEKETVTRAISPILEKGIPVCQFSQPGMFGWDCFLNFHNIEKLIIELEKMKSYILKRWQRHPYVFLRLLSITQQWGHALQNPLKPSQLESFCQRLQHTPVLERPLILKEKMWEEKICPIHTPPSVPLAKFAFYEAYKEIQVLFHMINLGSRRGSFSIKVPREKLGSGTLYVEMAPQAPVFENWEKLLESEKLHTKMEKTLGQNNIRNPQSCWHPAYQKRSPSSSTAHQLGKLGVSPNPHCLTAEKPSPQEKELLFSYLSQTTLGEMNFVISNGYTKYLRLPLGSYDYQVYELPTGRARWANRKIPTTIKGSMSWKKNRARLYISKLRK